VKYKKLPIVIDAFQYGIDEMPKWMQYYFDNNMVENEDYTRMIANTTFEHKRLLIKTLEGVMKAEIGDYVIKGVENELYPCDPDIFRQTYEIAE